MDIKLSERGGRFVVVWMSTESASEAQREGANANGILPMPTLAR